MRYPTSQLVMGLLALLCVGIISTSVSTSSARAEEMSPELQEAFARRVVMTFREMPVGEALKILAEQAEINIAIGSGVRGSITLYVDDVDVRTALDIVLELTENAYLIEDDVVRFITEEDYARETGDEFHSGHEIEFYKLNNIAVTEAVDALNKLDLMTRSGKIMTSTVGNHLVIKDVPETHERVSQLLELIDIDSDIKQVIIALDHLATPPMIEALTPHLTKDIGKAELLGSGQSIAITDLSAKIPELRELVEAMDVLPQQVLIEVKILQVAYSDETSVGINWQVVQEKLNSLDIRSSYSVLPQNNGTISGSGSMITIGDLAKDEFNVIVDALETFGNTDIVSLPRIMVVSGQEAKIHVGSSEPYVTVNTRESSGIINYYETVTQVDVGVKLNITPQVHPNEFVSLKIVPEVSSVSRFESTTSGTKIPVVEQSMLETSVQVKSGIYLILGGLMKKEHRKTNNGIPLLRSIPLLKYFFSNTSVKEVRTELVVMIQPRIVTGKEMVELEGLDESAEAALGRGK